MYYLYLCINLYKHILGVYMSWLEVPCSFGLVTEKGLEWALWQLYTNKRGSVVKTEVSCKIYKLVVLCAKTCGWY